MADTFHDVLNAWRNKVRQPFTWKRKRFILPHKCQVSNEWSGFFPIMYIGKKESRYSRRIITRMVSAETMMLSKLTGDEIW